MKKNKMTQEDMVLQHLKEFGGITALDAVREYGILRLSARILNLRKQGYEITTDYLTSKNRYGSWVTFAKYVLVDK